MRIAAVLSVVAAGLVPSFPVHALELNANLSVAPEYHSNNRDSPYYVGPPTVPERYPASRQDLEVRAQEGGAFIQSTLRWQTERGAEPEARYIANQFYYDGSLGEGLNWTAGKKVLTWGVGFAFRPLDVVQREDRRKVNQPALVGRPLLAMEYFTASDAWTVAWVNPTRGEDGSDRQDEALALRWYRFDGNDDLHAVMRFSRKRKVEGGVGATRVVGDEWSFHGAALYGRRYTKTLNALTEDSDLFASANPMTEEVKYNGIKAVAGVQWTGKSGWSALAEAYYDADAYSRDEWRRLDNLTSRQIMAASLVPPLAVEGNIAWSSQAYLNTNLLRENVLLRLAYDDSDGFKPYVELLMTPRDWGMALTAGFAYERDRQRFSGGIRYLGGANDSVYARAPEKNIFWLQWNLAL